MELSQLFPIEGAWNANATKGATERDRTLRAEGELAKLYEELKIKQAEDARAAEKHPLTLEELRLKNRHQGIQNDQGEFNLGLDRKFKPTERQGTIDKQGADTDKVKVETANATAKQFLEEAAKIVAMKGAATPQDLQGVAKRLGLPPDHPVVQTAMATDPSKQRQAFATAQLQDEKTQGQLANTRLQGVNQMNVERERTARAEAVAAARVKGQIDAAKLRNGTVKTWEARTLQIIEEAKVASTPEALARLDGEYREIQRLINEGRAAAVQNPPPTVQPKPGGGVEIVTPQGPKPQSLPQVRQQAYPTQEAAQAATQGPATIPAQQGVTKVWDGNTLRPVR
jgi:hypothetical protein